VRWKSGGDLTPLVGRDVCVSLVGDRAKLFSFYFDPAVAVDSPVEESVK
jgi:hypothetical protein